MNSSVLHGVFVTVAVAVLLGVKAALPAIAVALGPVAGPAVAAVLLGLIAAGLHALGQDDTPAAPPAPPAA